MKLFEITSKGQEVSDFMDYLEIKAPKKYRIVLEDLGTKLFKEGWSFEQGAVNNGFHKGTNDEGNFRIMVPVRFPDRYQKTTELNIHYYKTTRHHHGIYCDRKLHIAAIETLDDVMRDMIDDSAERVKNAAP
jgi:hypothetical protein